MLVNFVGNLSLSLTLSLSLLAPKREFACSSLRWLPEIVGWPGRYENALRCGGLSMVLLQLKDPLELFPKEKGTSSRFQVSISSRYDLK